MASQAGLKEVVSLYQTLIKEWNRKPVDLEKVGKLLSGMKVSGNVSFSSNTVLLLLSYATVTAVLNLPNERDR